MSDDVRWFDPLGICRECRKPATGVLRGSRNDSYGPYCAPCAERRLKKAKAERETEKARAPVTSTTDDYQFLLWVAVFFFGLACVAGAGT